MPLYRDEGVVLRTADLGEADRIITMLTRDHGKIRAVARGVRRLKSRFGGRLEPFMRVDALVATGRTFDVISQVDSIAAYASSIGGDYALYTAANVIAEAADRLIGAEHERATAQYRLLIGALAALSRRAHDPVCIADSYVMRALALAGWMPRLASCVMCGEPIGSPAFLSVSSGGVMCVSDRAADAHRVDAGTLAAFRALVDGDWRVLDGGPLPSAAHRLVEEWSEYYLERPIRSLRLLD